MYFLCARMRQAWIQTTEKQGELVIVLKVLVSYTYLQLLTYIRSKYNFINICGIVSKIRHIAFP